MSLGAAVGGFAQGLAGGMKLRSDLDDADQRRGLMKLQARQAQQQVDTGDEQAAARQEAAGIIQGYRSGNAELGFVRGQDGSYDPNLPENLNRYYELSRQSAARVANAHGRSAATAMAEVDELRRKGFAEQVNFATSQLGLGDFDGASATLKKVWSLTGDKREFVGVGLDPNDPKNAIIQFKAPGTDEVKTTSVPVDKLANNIIPYALNLQDSANFRAVNRRLEQDDQRLVNDAARVQLGKDELKALTEHRDAMLKFESQKWTEGQPLREAQIGYYNNMGKAALQRASSDKTAADLARTTQALNNQLGSVTTLLGIPKNFDPKTASKTDIDEYNNKLNIANNAMFLISNGIKDGKLSMDAPTAIKIAQAAENVPFKDIKSAGNGIYYTNVQGYNVPLSITDSQYKALEKANSKPAASGQVTASQRNGLTSAPPPVVTPATGLQIKPGDLPTNPRERTSLLRQRAQEAQAQDEARFAQEVQALLPNLDMAAADQLQRDARFSSLPLDVRTQIFKIANQR